jgi:CheY-like chemotaxis protein
MTARLLKSRGYEVDEANDGVEALEKFESSLLALNLKGEDNSNGYDVILMDSEMPRMSGPMATELLRQKGYIGIIVGVTGNVMQQEKDFFLGKGANRVLFKPLDLSKLEVALKELNVHMTNIHNNTLSTLS